jgi:hypothetical protein
MTDISVIDILRSYPPHDRFGPVIAKGLEMIKGGTTRVGNGEDSEGLSSLYYAKLWKSRLERGRLDKDVFLGVEETIHSLGAEDVVVRLSVVESPTCNIFVWLSDSHGPPVGVIVMKVKS